MEEAMMTKKFDSLREAFEAVCKEFKIDCDEAKMEALIGMWNKSWMLAKPYEEVQEELENLRKEHTLILVSNTDNFSINQVLDKFQLRQHFQHIFLSCELGLIKNDTKFLKKVLKEAKLAASDCVLVGDSIHSDMEAAKEAGIKSATFEIDGDF